MMALKIGISRITGQWIVVAIGDDDFHVLPIDDLRDHYAEMGCWCGPRFEDDSTIHNSSAGIERFERAPPKAH